MGARSKARVGRPAPAMHNEDVAAAFDEMAELLAIEGDNPFRVRAYQRAALVVRSLPRPLAELRTAKDFDALPGIGADLSKKIDELLRTGRLRALAQLRRQVPPGLRELLKLPGLGPVRVRALKVGLRIRGVEDLRRALAAGRLAKLRGFGPGVRRQLEQALAAKAPGPARRPWSAATSYVDSLRDSVRAAGGVAGVEVAGSYRRGRDTIADLDFVVVARPGVDLAALLRRHGDVQSLVAAGPTRCTAILRNGMHADFRLVPTESAGSALLYFTGSRDHNIKLRRRVQKRGLKLNEYGLFRGRRRVAGRTERELYAALGLPFIPPELREDRGEIEAAERGKLPKLVSLDDLQGDLHVHTDASDGQASLEAMARAAQARGLAYIAIADHSRHLGIVHGLDAGGLSRQADAIDALNDRLDGLHVLKGVEVDILADGSLALPDPVLRRLDVVVAAIHGHFDLPEAKQTARILRALEHPCVTILAHPSGRLLGDREPCAFDFAKVLAAARARPCYLELNSQPARLDMDDVMCHAAREQGVLVSIASDAHAPDQFADLACGVRQARRGWLASADVLNARPLKELRRCLARARL